MRAPLFWEDTGLLSTLLLPVSAVYGAIVAWRQQHARAQKLSVPVICIGNLVAGGAGKTPVALALGAMLKAKNIPAHYLLRGYKGRMQGPVQVDPENHSAREVGDEALLLARMLPTWVAADRVAGGKAAIAAGAAMILMDDGFQNLSLHKDVSFLVVDGHHGFGNGRLIPAGPLREPVAMGLARANAVILMGDDRKTIAQQLPAGTKLFTAHIRPAADNAPLKGAAVVAFAGIARPRKFYRTLQSLGCDIRKMIAYPDHHAFTQKDLEFLLAKAKEYNAHLVTTAKDYVRLPVAMRAQVSEIKIEAVFDEPDDILHMVIPDA